MLASRVVSALLPRADTDELVRVLVADDEPALRDALSELLAQEPSLTLVGTAADADEAASMAAREQPDVALIDVSMPAGGGPRAAREIARTSPHTRVIALSAFEDRTTVMEMLRAGAVGYLVKGAAGEDIVGSIHRVATGRASISADVVDGIVHELSSQLRREEIELQHSQARAAEIHRFATGEGLAILVQPIMDLRTREPVGLRGAGAVPIAAAATARRVVRRGRRARARHAPRAGHDRARAGACCRELPPDTYLSLNSSHRTVRSPELAALLEPHAARIVVEITEHEPVDDYEELAAGAAAASCARGADRDRRRRRRATPACATRWRSTPTS